MAGPSFSNEEALDTVTYDFVVDAGAIGAKDIFTAAENIIITHFHATVLAAVTTSASGTVAVGVTGSLSRFMTAAQGAAANLTLNASVVPLPVEGAPNVLALPVFLAANNKVIQTIATGALTAGRIKYVMKYIKA